MVPVAYPQRLALSPGELEIYSDFFPEPWQITLLVCPEPDGDTRGAFFGRESDGSVRSDSSVREFSFPARPSSILRKKEGRRQGKTAEPNPEPTVVLTPQPAPPPSSAEPTLFPVPAVTGAAPGRRIKWTWLAAWGLLFIGLAVWATRWVRADRSPQPISLALIERDGQLRIEWDRGARPVAKAVRGSLEIVDGSGTQTIALTPPDLAAGVLTYERKSGDVEVRMTVQEAGGQAVEEASRFLGNPPGQKADPAEIDALTQQRDGLEVELKRLRGENAAQADRIKQLETMLRSLEERLGVK